MSGKSSGFNSAVVWFFDSSLSYSTLRSVKINSVTVSLIYRIAQVIILAYIIGWELVYKKGYQSSDDVSSTVTTKVKGFGYTLNKNTTFNTLEEYQISQYNRLTDQPIRIYDTADYIIPPNEYNSIFVMSNYIQTEQSPNVCDEDFTKINVTCQQDSDCQNKVYNTWNGIPTGRCVNSTRNTTLKVCEVNAWCPVEYDSLKGAISIANVENYTIFIKNDIEFKTFNKKERNIPANFDNAAISNCIYNPITSPSCPVFLINDILNSAEPNATERALMLLRGGIIQIEIAWNCNYDLHSPECLPKYTFARFDLPFYQNSAASGFNFRYADKYKVNNVSVRTLVKAYGLRFIIIVSGKAGKFNIIPLFLTIGSGIGLLSISSIVAECFMKNCAKRREFFREITEISEDKFDKKSVQSSENTKY